MDVFVSIGSGLSAEQETFVQAIETRLRAEGLAPHTLNRNEWSTLAPLDAVDELMGRCCGVVIIGLERYRFSDGIERHGSDLQHQTGSVRLATPWNQIEAALAYSKRLPLLVIVDEQLKADGLLEPGHNWHVARVPVRAESLQTLSFNGLLKDWQSRMRATAVTAPKGAPLDPATSSLSAILGALRPAEFWALLGAIAVLLAGAFGLGVKFGPLLDKPEVQQTVGKSK
jgi:hypothetical protein